MKAREELNIKQIKSSVKDWKSEVRRSKYYQMSRKYKKRFVQWFGWLIKIANEIEYSSSKALLDSMTITNYEAVKQVTIWKRSRERLF